MTVLDYSRRIVVPIRQTLRLIRCGCEFANHSPGQRILVTRREFRFTTGEIDGYAETRPSLCPNGEWAVEQTLQAGAPFPVQFYE